MKQSLKFIIALFCLGFYHTVKAQGVQGTATINLTFLNRNVDYVNNIWTFDIYGQAGTNYAGPSYNDWSFFTIRADIAVPAGVTITSGSGTGNAAYMDATGVGVNNSVPGTPPVGSVEIGFAMTRNSQGELTATPVRLASITVNFTGGTLTGNEVITPRQNLTTSGSFWTNALAGSSGTKQNFSQPTTFTLPITLVNFTATKAALAVNLNWEVSAEINAKGYEVERSANGSNFTVIGKIAATGKGNYSSVDANPLSGVNYYRLKMLDKDGKFKYSDVRTVLFDGTAVVFDIFPNPVISNKLNLHLQQYNYEGKAQAIIKDMLGRSIQTTGVNIVKGNNQLPIVLTGLNSGSYFVTLHTANGTVIAEPLKFVKQ